MKSTNFESSRLSWVYTSEFSRGEPRGSLVYVAVCSAAVHCEVMRIETDPIARRAKITRGNELPDQSFLSSD